MVYFKITINTLVNIKRHYNKVLKLIFLSKFFKNMSRPECSLIVIACLHEYGLEINVKMKSSRNILKCYLRFFCLK